MVRRTLYTLAIVIVAGTLALTARGADARGTLDQSFTGPTNAAGPLPAGAPSQVGEGFTAGLTGQLDTATIALEAVFGTPTVTLTLYATDSNGLPLTPLASTTAQVTTPLSVGLAITPAQYTVFTFAAPAHVVAGQRYALAVSNVQPAGAAVSYLGSIGATVPGGFGLASPSGAPGTWIAFPNQALDFQTFVSSSVTVTGQPLLGLTIATKGCGTTSPSGTVSTYQSQNVIVRATPCSGSTFTGWTGGPCDGTRINPCDIGVGANMTVTANFAP